MKCRECNRDLDYGPFIQMHGTHDYFCYRCIPSMQPERLNPEDHFLEDLKMVYDSPTTENKESP